MTLDEACNAVRLYVEAKEFNAGNSVGTWNWLERLDDCLADIRAELAEASQDDGKWSYYLDMPNPTPATSSGERARVAQAIYDAMSFADGMELGVAERFADAALSALSAPSASPSSGVINASHSHVAGSDALLTADAPPLPRAEDKP